MAKNIIVCRDYTGLRRLRGTTVRDIPKDATIHPSAIKRYQKGVDGYAPANWS